MSKNEKHGRHLLPSVPISRGEIVETVQVTKSCLTKSLCHISGLPLDFISIERLHRPPFAFIHALVKLFVEQLSFAKSLYDEKELESAQSLSRQEKIRFLFKALACVSLITNERLDLFVSPAKMLSGQDALATNHFFQCLSRAAQVTPELSMQKASEVIQRGVNKIYKQSVKTRNMIVKFQAIFRGKLVRGNKTEKRNDSFLPHQTEESIHDSDSCDLEQESSHEEDKAGKAEKIVMKIVEAISPDSSDEEGETECIQNIGPCSSGQLPEENSKNSKSTTSAPDRPDDNSKKENVSDDATAPCVCSKSTNRKLPKPVQRTKVCGKEKDGDHSKSNARKYLKKQPSCLATIPEKKVLKKYKIVNGIKLQQELTIFQSTEMESQETKTKTREEEIDILLSQLKSKLKRLQERESKLEQKVEAARQKEEHLQICESRVTRLAQSLHKKQERLKQERMKQAIEIDKLRLEASDASLRCTTQSSNVVEEPEDDNEQRYEDLWKRACENPTITDLRLKLEARQRAMKKRQEKIVKLEKELLRRLEEVEEERRQMNEERKANNESLQKHLVSVRQKRKSQPSKQKSKITKAQKKNGNENEESRDQSPSSSRRQAFLGKAIANKELLEKLAEVANAREKMQQQKHSKPGELQIQSHFNRSSPSTAQDNNGPLQKSPMSKSSKTSPLSRKISAGNVLITRDATNNTPSDDLPRSLVRYSSHYNNNNERPNNLLY